MSRRYKVVARQGRDRVSDASFGEAETALIHFENMLSAAGHSDEAVSGHVRVLTAALMSGANGYTVLDPDLKGATELIISTVRGQGMTTQ